MDSIQDFDEETLDRIPPLGQHDAETLACFTRVFERTERFVLTIKSECLNRMIFFGESSFRRACASFLDHYHVERAHQGLGNERIERAEFPGTGEVECSERLGGLLKYYRRAA